MSSVLIVGCSDGVGSISSCANSLQVSGKVRKVLAVSAAVLVIKVFGIFEDPVESAIGMGVF